VRLCNFSGQPLEFGDAHGALGVHVLSEDGPAERVVDKRARSDFMAVPFLLGPLYRAFVSVR